MLFVQSTNEVADLRTEDSFHWPLLRRDDMDFDAAHPQRSRDLKPDEARPNDERAARFFSRPDDRAAIRERAQCVDVRLFGAGNRQAHWFRAGRQQERS